MVSWTLTEQKVIGGGRLFTPGLTQTPVLRDQWASLSGILYKKVDLFKINVLSLLALALLILFMKINVQIMGSAKLKMA